MGWAEFVLGGFGGAIVAGGIGTYTAIRIDRLNGRVFACEVAAW